MENDGIKSSFSREAPHVNLVDKVIPEGKAKPVLVFPRTTGIDDLGGTVNTLGLKSGSRVGVLLLTVQPVSVKAPHLNSLHRSMVVSLIVFA